MAIQPIDLQTLFTQMDKVGRQDQALREGVVTHQAQVGEQIQKRNLEKQQTVNAAQEEDTGPKKAGDEAGGGGEYAESHSGEKKPEKDEKLARLWTLPTVSDPMLGSNVDLSG